MRMLLPLWVERLAMAEGGARDDLSLQKLDEELTCPVCTEHFKDPKVLPCLHYYCKTCIADLIKRAVGGRFNCPECRREVQADPGSFPAAFFMNRMEEVFSVMKKAEDSKKSVRCQGCSKLPSVAFCQTCNEYICSECDKAHKNMHRFSSHVVVSIDSLRSPIGQCIAAEHPIFLAVSKEVKCSKHEDEPLKLYCSDCSKLVCRDCIVIDHKDHRYAFVVDAAPKFRTEIEQKVESVKKISAELKTAVKSLTYSEKKVSASSTATTKAIDDALDKIASKLMKKRKELKEKTQRMVNEVKGKIAIQEKNAQLAMGELESLLEFMNRNLKMATDQEMLSLEKQMSDQVLRVSQLYGDPEKTFSAPELPKLEVCCRVQFEELIDTEISVELQTVCKDFSNLNPDALALVQKLSGAEIPGIEYHIKEGRVRVLLKGECEAEETISKFQDAYKKVASRRIREENVAIPAARSKEEVEEQIAKFEQMYAFCTFVMDEEKRHVKVISQARQFEQAKKFLEEALHNPSEPSVATASTAVQDVMVMNISPNHTLTLKRGDIARERADALVNAANGGLLHGGGVAGALNAASQYQLQKFSSMYMEKRKWRDIPVGEVAVTCGGENLQCSHVIHAVSPEGTKRSPAECEHLVKLAIHNTFEAAERHNVTSIALPALSCGIFGVDSDLVARSIVEAVKSFKYSKLSPVLSDIRIVILDKPTHSCFARHFSQATKKRSVKNAHDHRSQASRHTTDAGKKPTPIESIPLGIDDLPWIMTSLRPIASKWKEILIKLGVQNEQMLRRKSDATVLLKEGVSEWLNSQVATLAGLAAALTSHEVGERGIASEIVKDGLQRKISDKSSDLTDVTYPQLTEKSPSDGVEGTKPKDEDCPICLERFTSPVKTKCGHTYCKKCIERAVQFDPYCPTCKKPLRPVTGKQPHGGTMTRTFLPYPVPGYEGYRTIQINYTIQSGVQGLEHPNPGKPYTGTTRTAYLPDNQEGREVFQLLHKAFLARMIFTVGTTGAQNIVVWNDIHHKTNISGGQQSYGYPDPTYLQRVKEDLAAKGIVP